MATLITSPPSVSFANNALEVVIESDHITPDQEAYILIEYATAAGPSVNDSFDVDVNADTYTFTFVATPANTYQIAVKGSMTESDWFDYLTEYFRSHPVFSELFNTTVMPGPGTMRLKLIWRKLEIIALTVTINTVSNLNITAQAITVLADVDNLTAYINITDADTQAVIIQKVGNYDYATGRCRFTIGEAFDAIKATLPDPALTAPTVATGSYLNYYIRYADRFGYPAVTEARTASTVKTVIAGGTSSGIRTPFFTPTILVLHQPTPAAKLITAIQPDWLYLCSQSDLVDVFFAVYVYLDDDTAFFTDPYDPFDLNKGEPKYIATGFKQLGLDLLTLPTGTTIIGYDIKLQHTAMGIFHSHNYEIDAFTRHPWNVYVLLDTGLGGMETVRLKGKRVLKYNADSTVYENESGELSTAFAEGSETIEVSTGYYPLEYIQKLRQLLLGTMHLVTITTGTPDSYTFTKIIADTKSFDIVPDDNDLHALIFAFKKAKMEKQHNSF